jgi:hypothetical protein
VLSFSRGTNTTANLQDKRISISIKGMTLVQEGSEWKTEGDTITYAFLGQTGSGNLVDFIAP